MQLFTYQKVEVF